MRHLGNNRFIRYYNIPYDDDYGYHETKRKEEYFAMKELGFAKISSFEYAPTKKIVFFYDKLTYKQTDKIYPR